jgi:hypothetical protein
MSKKSKEYAERFEAFLETIGVTGQYFCKEQHKRWIGEVEEAYDKVEKSREKGEED